MAKTTYKGSGVDIEAGNLFVDLIKPLAASTLNKHVLGKIGGFSGAFEIPLKKYKKPVLVAATDGVGTKLKIAFMTGRLDSVGIDLVAMNVNDIIACGADPLFFLDYIATSKLDPKEGVEDHGCYRMTNIERTLVEAFRYASKIGLRIAFHATRTAIKEKQTSIEKIHRQAKKLKLEKFIERYWEALISESEQA